MMVISISGTKTCKNPNLYHFQSFEKREDISVLTHVMNPNIIYPF